METDFNAEYDLIAKRLDHFSSGLERLIRDLLRAEGIPIHSVTCRVKLRESCLRKLQRSDGERPLSYLTDILGLRIITYFRDEVNDVARVIEREFSIDWDNSVDKSAALEPDRFGYLSLHYICQISASRATLAEYRDIKDLKFEVQIRSILQHAWAEIEHDLGYKSQAAVPREVRRQFSRLAGLLEIADDEFVGIREKLVTHQADSAAAIGQGDLNVEIDQDSLYSFVESDSRVKALDTAIMTIMKRPPSDELMRAFIGKQVGSLTSVGMESIAEISGFLDSERDLIIACANEWAETTQARQEETPMSRGVTLVFVYIIKRGIAALGSNPGNPDQYGELVRRASQRVGRKILTEGG